MEKSSKSNGPFLLHFGKGLAQIRPNEVRFGVNKYNLDTVNYGSLGANEHRNANGLELRRVVLSSKQT